MEFTALPTIDEEGLYLFIYLFKRKFDTYLHQIMDFDKALLRAAI